MPTNSVPLSPRVIDRAPGTADENTEMWKPAGTFSPVTSDGPLGAAARARQAAPVSSERVMAARMAHARVEAFIVSSACERNTRRRAG